MPPVNTCTAFVTVVKFTRIESGVRGPPLPHIFPLPRQRALVHAQVVALNDESIGGDRVPVLEQADIPHDQVPHTDLNRIHPPLPDPLRSSIQPPTHPNFVAEKVLKGGDKCTDLTQFHK